jgi:hypothetical protein
LVVKRGWNTSALHQSIVDSLPDRRRTAHQLFRDIASLTCPGLIACAKIAGHTVGATGLTQVNERAPWGG